MTTTWGEVGLGSTNTAFRVKVSHVKGAKVQQILPTEPEELLAPVGVRAAEEPSFLPETSRNQRRRCQQWQASRVVVPVVITMYLIIQQRGKKKIQFD